MSEKVRARKTTLSYAFTIWETVNIGCFMSQQEPTFSLRTWVKEFSQTFNYLDDTEEQEQKLAKC